VSLAFHGVPLHIRNLTLKSLTLQMKLKNKVAVITGAGRGIGKSIALAFAREGADLILGARTAEQIEEVKQEVLKIGVKAHAVPCDVSSAGDMGRLASEADQAFGRVDILVNNAGISKRSKFLEYEDETWLEVIKVNLFGAYLCTKAILPLIQKVSKGRILMMASTAAKGPVPFSTAYSASKHGLLGLTRSLAAEVALSGYPGITVNAICPFFVDTDMFSGPQGYVAQISRDTDKPIEDVARNAVGRNLQGRILRPEEIAALAVFLASDEAEGLTGQSINICGGAAFH
jgi:NAD(P)-dependent dehydrogenase (short-subunit alcohol dehydrogenase family)